ncbi:sodium:calcium antiporter [Candidatus Dojkabacteria bacterium]|nr:sodium:calcium antiporter [Candidatus Dojkabacteria bacterium]
MERIALDILLSFGLLYLLIKSADLLEDTFVQIAQKARLSPFLIGFLVLAIASSLPEMSVAVNSSLEGVPGISIGNLFGATIVILSLIIGLNAIKHKSIPFKGSYSFSFLLLSLILIGLMVILTADGELVPTDGLILITSYILLILFIVKNVVSHHKTKKYRKKQNWKLYAGGLLGLAGLIISSHLLVEKTVGIALFFGIPNAVIGLLMLGIGTNIPELTLLIRSNTLEKEKLAVGNFIGSAMINVPTLGLLSLLSPHKIEYFQVLVPAMAVLALTLIVFALIAFSGREITRKEGFFLLGIYVLWIISEVILLIKKF